MSFPFFLFSFLSETKKNILIEEQKQERQKKQKKEKKPREGWEVLPTQIEQIILLFLPIILILNVYSFLWELVIFKTLICYLLPGLDQAGLVLFLNLILFFFFFSLCGSEFDLRFQIHQNCYSAFNLLYNFSGLQVSCSRLLR